MSAFPTAPVINQSYGAPSLSADPALVGDLSSHFFEL